MKSFKIIALALALAACATSATAANYIYRVFNKNVRAAPQVAKGSAVGSVHGAGDFGDVVEGDTVTRVFTFVNSGNKAAANVSAWLSDYPDFSFTSNTCGTNSSPTSVGFAAGANTCEMTVAFTPSTAESSLAGLGLGVKGDFTGSPQTVSFSVQAVPLSVTLSAASLPAGLQGSAYDNGTGYDLKSLLSSNSQSFDKSKATWSVVSGSLPEGLTLGADGVIFGTPAAENAGAPFTIQAVYKAKTGQQAFAIVVGPIQVTLSASTAAPPGATVGQAYNDGAGWDLKPNLDITGDAAYDGKGTGVTWSIAGGALPAGLSLNSSGVVTGTPTASGTNPVQVKALYKGKSVTQSYTIPVTQVLTQYSGYRAWSDGTLAKSCKEYRTGKAGYAYMGASGEGVYRIDVDGAGTLAPVDVVCDMTTDGGGWTVVQRRWNGSVDFYRTYAEYANGFGTTTEYWLGNNRLATMTASGSHSMRIDMMRTNGQTAYGLYNQFKIGPATDGLP
jgi:hypothetical protein